MILKFKQFLTEKLITYNRGKREGQVVILAGGSASGKGYAISNFIDSSSFKVIDVDELKKELINNKNILNQYPELRNLDLANPDDVAKIHKFVKDKRIDDKRLNALIQSASRASVKPNLMFDVTLDSRAKAEKIASLVSLAGYEPQNVHITWVLKDYKVALDDNMTRERRVPSDIVLQKHEGAALTMWDIIKFGSPAGIDGQIDVILNNPSLTIRQSTDRSSSFSDFHNGIKSSGEIKKIPVGFTYIRIKDAGSNINIDDAVEQLRDWIIKNAPVSI